MNFGDYDIGSFFDEMFASSGQTRAGTELLQRKIESLPPGELERRQAAAEKALFDMGITFNVYGHDEATEKIWPFDLVPRIVQFNEWKNIEAGLKQRIQALNLFVDDVYHEQKIVKDGVVPEELIFTADGFLKPCIGLNPPKGVWCHISGSDLVRDDEGRIFVLEDNLRCPSGVSYVIANRRLMKRTFPEVFAASNVQPVDLYPAKLLDMLYAIASPKIDRPLLTLLTPGAYNSAYFEHSFLAHETGIELVEGRDLVVQDGFVCMRTTKGLQKIDVIYRRLNDDFLDPKVFRPESVLGVPGLMEAYRAGRVAIANAPGTGVADDKVIYAFVEKMIKYYLDQDPLIPNVPTYLCWRKQDLSYVLEHLPELVVKSANESGGYGMLVGPAATRAECAEFAEKIKAEPRNFIAQPTLSLSRTPVIVDDCFEGRHVDLRPFILYGEDIFVLPGGLTRVALKKGSLVVNSSQGGGSKDTWVVDPDNPPEEYIQLRDIDHVEPSC
jgi:uncharacterized circularly permuted ATP-grasp superfamily protein